MMVDASCFGKINKDTLSQINQQRILDKQEPIHSQTATIPSDNIKHIYQRRILDNKYTPRDVSETISDALFKPDKIYQGNPVDHQILLHKIGRGGKMAVIDKNLKGDGISVITALKRRNVNNLEGRQSPSSVPSNHSLTGSKLSTPQTVNDNNISPMASDVNMTIEELLKKWRRLLGL